MSLLACRDTEQNSPTFVTFLTAGFPSVDATVPLMLAMERGGADIIELGVPFTDPLADGKAIQECNRVGLPADCRARATLTTKDGRLRSNKESTMLFASNSSRMPVRKD